MSSYIEKNNNSKQISNINISAKGLDEPKIAMPITTKTINKRIKPVFISLIILSLFWFNFPFLQLYKFTTITQSTIKSRIAITASLNLAKKIIPSIA
jgi:hypothetical protein